MHLDNARLRLAVFFVAISASVYAIWVKGPNLDEFWTVIFTDPRVDPATAWYWWSADTTHPPGYYALVRLWLNLFPVTVTSVRFLNLLPWFALACYWLFAASNSGRMRAFCAAFFICVSVTFFTLERLAEARAYFMAFALVCLLATELKGLESPVGAKARIARIVAASVGIALLDYPIFCAAAALLSVGAAALFLAARKKEAAGIVVAVVAGCLVVLAGVVNGMGHEQVVPPYYISTIAYAKFALAVVAVGLAGNLVISFIAARSMAGGLGRDFISSGWHREYDFRYVIALSTVVVLAEFLVLNLVLHAILSRHLIPITALVCASAAAWLPERTWSPSVVFAMVLAFALSAVLVCYRLAGMDNLHRFADLLAAEQRKCSGFKIIPIDMFALGDPANSVNGQTRALASRFGQLEIAREFGFALASSEDRVMDPRCGGAVWFVPSYPDQGATAVSLLVALNVPMDRAQRSGARMFHENTVLVVRVPGAGGGDPRQRPSPLP